jgi:hypothetical protein
VSLRGSGVGGLYIRVEVLERVRGVLERVRRVLERVRGGRAIYQGRSP